MIQFWMRTPLRCIQLNTRTIQGDFRFSLINNSIHHYRVLEKSVYIFKEDTLSFTSWWTEITPGDISRFTRINPCDPHRNLDMLFGLFIYVSRSSQNRTGFGRIETNIPSIDGIASLLQGHTIKVSNWALVEVPVSSTTSAKGVGVRLRRELFLDRVVEEFLDESLRPEAQILGFNLGKNLGKLHGVFALLF